MAAEIFEDHPSELARTMTISVLGACEQHDQAVKLVLKSQNISSASYNAAIAACAKVKDWKLAKEIYDKKIPKQKMTTLTSNALLTILAQCRRGKEALEILQNFPVQNYNAPSQVTYQIVIHALVRSSMIDEAFQILKDLAENKTTSVEPTETMFDMIIAGYNKRSDWKSIYRIDHLKNPHSNSSPSDVQKKYAFRHWEKLERVGKGKGSYFVVGYFLDGASNLNITIGVQPHRNPSKNGIQLEFWENRPSESPTKLGFLLMQNNKESMTSSLLGMFLTKVSRGKGIAKICLGIWIWFCIQASISPTTGVINKPLLALALQHRFGFVPEKGGIDIELVNANNKSGRLLMYSPSRKRIEGAFSPWDIQNQNMIVLKEPPNPRGRLVSVRTRFAAPSSQQELKDKVNAILPEKSIQCNLTPLDIQQLYLGEN
jgi:pentatricopeptide repeat protein